jgi:hypothetical protein
MTTKFIMGKDLNGMNSFTLPFSNTNLNTTLSSGVAQTCTAPTDAEQYYAVFGIDPGTKVWVAEGVTATVPGGSFAASVSQLNPTSRIVNSGVVLSFITPDTTAELNVSFYAI